MARRGQAEQDGAQYFLSRSPLLGQPDMERDAAFQSHRCQYGQVGQFLGLGVEGTRAVEPPDRPIQASACPAASVKTAWNAGLTFVFALLMGAPLAMSYRL